MQLKDVKLTKSRLRNINKAIDKYILEFPGEPRVIKKNLSLERIFNRLRNEDADRTNRLINGEAQRNASNNPLSRPTGAFTTPAHSLNFNTAIGYTATSATSTSGYSTAPVQLNPRQLETRRATIEDPSVTYPGYTSALFATADAQQRMNILELDTAANRADGPDEFIQIQERRAILYRQLISYREFHNV